MKRTTLAGLAAGIVITAGSLSTATAQEPKAQDPKMNIYRATPPALMTWYTPSLMYVLIIKNATCTVKNGLP
jgi:hypothetical protein